MDTHSRRSWQQQLRTVAPMAVMILIVAACSSSEDEASTATTAPPPAPTTNTATTAAPTTTATAPALTVDEALAVSEAYFAAYETADVEALRGLFALDAAAHGSADLEAFFGEWELISVWDRAQGAVKTVGECVADQPDGAPITVTCEYTDHHYIARAVGAPAVLWEATIGFDAAGKISTFNDTWVGGDYFLVNTPFNAWMRANHPDDASKVDCCGGDTVEESIARGTLRSEYADKWVAYLDANGCTYQDQGC